MKKQFRQENPSSLHIAPITFANVGKLSRIPVPLVRLWTCGMLKLEVLTSIGEDNPPGGTYEDVVSQDVRGRGAIPALMLLKKLLRWPLLSIKRIPLSE